ncbi:MAG: mercuric reductase [Myxococcales bacterium]|nr:mercuric reductase [Myxococcales bacterium]
MTLEADPHDQAMVALVRPAGWGITAAADYDLVAIGGGTGGLVAATGAALMGARTALVERQLLGGDCLVHGCVPSKALLHAARVAHDARRGAEVGVDVGDVTIDFARVMAHVRRTRAQIAPDDSAATLAERGADVIFGTARFTGPRTLEIGGREVRFKRAIVATGARPFVPDIPGLAEHGLTNEQIFDLQELPERLVVVGGGPIGCELGQAFRRLGSQVTLLQRGPRLLPRDDPEASAILLEVLRGEGIDVRLQTTLAAVHRRDDGLRVQTGDGEHISCDQVLVATGRIPNTQGLGLEAAGVDHTRRGIVVDGRQRTSNRRIYAVGDVAQGPNFTHAAYAQAEWTVYNALTPLRRNPQTRPMPWATFTDPEVAHIGLDHAALQALGDRVHTVTLGFDHNDRARTDGHPLGFGRIHVRRGTDRILAATFVGRDAAELLGEVAVAMTHRKGLGAILDAIHPYPTRSWLTMYLANERQLQRLTPTLKTWLGRWFRWGLR